MDHSARYKAPKVDAVLTHEVEQMSVSMQARDLHRAQKACTSKDFICVSPAMQRVQRQIDSLARLEVPVLILGESGTGRKTVARCIHEVSSRAKCVFERITCEGFPEELLDAELFGRVKNGNGRAPHSEIGKFESCANGTILLEEVSHIPIGLQAKILHAVRDGEFFRKGSNSKTAVNVRIMATNHIDIEQSIRDKKLREDLFFVLCAFPIELPPLRERKEDIPLLLWHYMERLAVLHGRAPKTFSAALVEACQEYGWPGNLRELENLVHRYLIMGNNSLVIHNLRTRTSRPFLVSRQVASESIADPQADSAGRNSSVPGLKGLVRHLRGETEMSAIRSALQQTGWNRRRAALLLNISYRGLLYKIREYGLVPLPPS